MSDDPAAILALYQDFVDKFRVYHRIMDANQFDDDAIWDVIEAYDEAFARIADRDDDLRDLVIAALRQENDRHDARSSEATTIVIQPRPTLKDRLKTKRALAATIDRP